MFSNYKIVGNTLYLYVDYSCEIGSIFDKEKNYNLLEKVRKYIKERKIKFNGIKVVLLLSGLMLGTVYLNKPNKDTYEVYKDNKYVYNIVDKSVPNIKKEENIKQEPEEVVNNNDTTNAKPYNSKTGTSKLITNQPNNNSIITNNVSNIQNEQMITLRRTNGEVLNLTMIEYLIGVVAAEMPASFNTEALKAQSVVARTYTNKLIEYGRVLTDDVSTQVYKSNEELRNMWGNDFYKYYQKVSDAVKATGNEVITYDGKLIDAVYHSTSNGYTEDSLNVWGNYYPYLKSVTSPWDTSASSFSRMEDISYDKLSSILNMDVNPSSNIDIVSRNESGRISKIVINNKEYTGVELRNLLGLRSADFDIQEGESSVTFLTRGYGHGVGMSQYGANGMANAGYGYKQILNYYYTGVTII